MEEGLEVGHRHRFLHACAKTVGGKVHQYGIVEGATHSDGFHPGIAGQKLFQDSFTALLIRKVKIEQNQVDGPGGSLSLRV